MILFYVKDKNAISRSQPDPTLKVVAPNSKTAKQLAGAFWEAHYQRAANPEACVVAALAFDLSAYVLRVNGVPQDLEVWSGVIHLLEGSVLSYG